MRLIDADKLNLWSVLRQYCSSDACCEVTDMIDNAPTINPYEWISVDDRLPEKNQDVLCCTSDKDDQPFIGYRDQYCGYWCKGRWAYTWGKITHWMPLPTPPADKEN